MSSIRSSAGEAPENREEDGRPIHVLLFCGSYPPRIGGYECHVWETSRRLRNEAASVTVVTPDPDHKNGNRSIYQGIIEDPMLLEFGAVWMGNDTLGVPRPAVIPALLSLPIRDNTVVITETRFFPSSWMGWALAILRRLPLLHVEHGGSHPRTGSKLIDATAKILDHTAGWLLSRRGTQVVAVSKASHDFLMHLGVPKAKISIVRVGLDGTVNAPRDDGNGRGDVKVIGFAGRLVFGKGVEVLLQAFNMIHREFPDAQLWIAGDGPLSHSLKELRDELQTPHVSFLGAVPHDKMPALYRQLDILVSPSLSEGFGLVLLEAAQQGCAIVASDLPAHSEILVPGEEFSTTHAGDPTHLAQRLREVLRDDSLRENLARAATNKAKNWPDWDATVANLMDKVRQAAGAKRVS